MSKTFDVGIIGIGVAGAFAAYKLATKHKGIKVLGIELGRPPAKRRSQICGFLGCLPNSDGKLYLNDLDKLTDLVGARKSKSSYKYVSKVLANVNNFPTIKDQAPNSSLEKKFNKIGYDIVLNDYIQMFPRDIHMLSKHIADTIENNKNITFAFDQEVISITKQKRLFVLKTDEQEFKCKKLILAVGRGGWRWAREVFANFGIVDANDVARYGIRVETNAGVMKDFNKSNCSIISPEVELGPFCWNGTVIPEDHVNMAISAFRANEARWKTDKVSFNLIGNLSYPNKGFEQTDRIGQLTFVITNERIIKERISHILNDKSTLSNLPRDYDWLKPTITQLATVMPELLTKGYFHAPTIIPLPPKINIGDDLSTEVDGLYVVGEAASIPGILAAMCMGTIVSDSVS